MTRANLLTGPKNTPATTDRNLGMAIGPGTGKALVEPLGKANTRALAYSTAETTAFEKAGEQGTQFVRHSITRRASKASALF